MRQVAGALVCDWPRLAWCLRAGRDPRRAPWLWMRNRADRITAGPAGIGAKCEWEYTRDLHLCSLFGAAGKMLMRRALRDWPVNAAESAPAAPAGDAPQVSFVIGHRGRARLQLLLMTLRTIRAQANARVECIVVEQSARPEVAEELPGWVRYLHSASPDPERPYCRSAALNAGARLAGGDLLVLHDGDMMVPAAYARELLSVCAQGYEVINLKRLIFYLGEEQTGRVLAAGCVSPQAAPRTVVQNLEAGGSCAVARAAYFELGGFDESFVGWGGEDNEFWDRALTRRVYPYGYLPIVHLWHASQPEKHDRQRPTLSLCEQRLREPVADRIARLRVVVGE